MIEPPYGIIRNSLEAGLVIPFLGAGASCAGGRLKDKWNPEEPKCFPSGAELARFLADQSEFPSEDPHDREDLSKVASYYADVGGRKNLRMALRNLFKHNFAFGSIHEFLANTPACRVIVVTNYDNLLEQAFQAIGRPYDLVIYPTDCKGRDKANTVLWRPHGKLEPKFIVPNELYIDLSTTNVIFKMHGTIVPEPEGWDNFVITEEDYVEFLSRMITRSAIPSLFYEHFRDRSFLFLGYSLHDWNLRVVLKNLGKYLSGKRSNMSPTDEEPVKSWAIQDKPSELEKKLWSNRGVEIFDIALDEFVSKMRKRMKKTNKVSKVRE